MEISIILDNKVVYSKDFGDYAKKLKDKKPDGIIMRKMENKFLELMTNDKSIKQLYSIAMGIATATVTPSTCYAASDLAAVGDKIRVLTSPITELLASLGYPITYGMLIVGAIMIITGRKSKGLDVIKWACMGYIGLQFVPFLLSLLEMIGRELRRSL